MIRNKRVRDEDNVRDLMGDLLVEPLTSIFKCLVVVDIGFDIAGGPLRLRTA